MESFHFASLLHLLQPTFSDNLSSLSNSLSISSSYLAGFPCGFSHLGWTRHLFVSFSDTHHPLNHLQTHHICFPNTQSKPSLARANNPKCSSNKTVWWGGVHPESGHDSPSHLPEHQWGSTSSSPPLHRERGSKKLIMAMGTNFREAQTTLAGAWVLLGWSAPAASMGWHHCPEPSCTPGSYTPEPNMY